MPDFVDRLGAELRHAADAEPLPPPVDAAARQPWPLGSRFSTVRGSASTRLGRRGGQSQARHRRAVQPLGLSRRPVTFVSGGIGVAAVAVAAVLLVSPTTQPAYALSQNADGSITVTIQDLETAVPALNARLAAIGADDRVVPVEANCPTGNPTIGAMMVYPQVTATQTITIGATSVEPGYTGVIAAEQLPSGEVAMAVESMKAPVPSCFPTTAYTLQNTGRTNNGTPIYQFVPVGPPTTSTNSSSSPTNGG